MVNQDDITITENTLVSVYEDYENQGGSKLINDGEFHIFGNWDNNGIVTFTNSLEGTTLFTGNFDQVLTGDQISNFNNVVFDNTSAQTPFHLGTTISIDKKALFNNGIIEGKSYDGEVIFNQNATSENTGNQSFVKGKVVKTGNSSFEYPVGDDVFYRPLTYNPDSDYVMTAEYFKQNSNDLYPHINLDENISEINNSEYWTVNQSSENKNMILSLTIDQNTTPSSFFNIAEGYTIAIVRWDETSSKWISEGGAVSDPLAEGNYQQLITSQVSSYGIFTVAIIKKNKSIVNDELTVFNAVSPNNDGINDTFHIKGIINYPENTVEVYNRWGVLVYETKNYNESDNMFGGYSEGRATINNNVLLPEGTYFYILKYKKDGSMINKNGYLYIRSQ